MDRRQFLAGATLSLAGFTAGCSVLSSGPDPSGYVRPEGDPPEVPERRRCDRKDFTQWSRFDDGDPNWGEIDNFALRVNQLAFDYGETVTITLTNTSGGEVITGVEQEYQFEVYTERGWEEIRYHRVGHYPALESAAIGHRPGEGFEWNITLTETGLADASPRGLVVCPELASGRYRLEFAGADAPVAVAFDLQR